jgi:hypothetical protein
MPYYTATTTTYIKTAYISSSQLYYPDSVTYPLDSVTYPLDSVTYPLFLLPPSSPIFLPIAYIFLIYIEALEPHSMDRVLILWYSDRQLWARVACPIAPVQLFDLIDWFDWLYPLLNCYYHQILRSSLQAPLIWLFNLPRLSLQRWYYRANPTGTNGSTLSSLELE